MKAKYIALAMAVLLSFSFVGCSGRNESSNSSLAPTSSPAATTPGNQNDQSNHNDALEGGGAGGTNDSGNSGQSNANPDPSARVSGNGVINDIGNAAGDLVEGAGNAIRDAGNAVDNAVNDVVGNSRTAKQR